MSEAITSWRDKYLAFKTRHSNKMKKAGETTMMVGQAVGAGFVGFALGAAEQKWAKPEVGYTNLAQIRIGPVPLTLLLSAAGLGLAGWGSDEKWAAFPEAGGIGALASYGHIQGRRMTIDWQKTQVAKAA